MLTFNDTPALVFPGLEIRLHQRRVLKDRADIYLTRLEYGALCYLAAIKTVLGIGYKFASGE